MNGSMFTLRGTVFTSHNTHSLHLALAITNCFFYYNAGCMTVCFYEVQHFFLLSFVITVNKRCTTFNSHAPKKRTNAKLKL